MDTDGSFSAAAVLIRHVRLSCGRNDPQEAMELVMNGKQIEILLPKASFFVLVTLLPLGSPHIKKWDLN